MIELKLVLNNDQAALLDRHLAMHEVGLTDHFADGVTRFSMPEEDEVIQMVAMIHQFRAQIRAHEVQCTEKDREDIRTHGRRLALLRKMRTKAAKGGLK